MLLANIARYLNLIQLETGYVSLLKGKKICLLSIVDNIVYFKTDTIIKIPNQITNINLESNQLWKINNKIIIHSDCIDMINKQSIVQIPNEIPESINYLFHNKIFLKHGFTSMQRIINDKLKGKCNIVVMIEKINTYFKKKQKTFIYYM